jgi:hypothetical protein
MLIGFIEIHRNWMPPCESGIGRWREHNKKHPAPGSATKEEEAQQLRAQWHNKEDEVLEELKQAFLDNPV